MLTIGLSTTGKILNRSLFENYQKAGIRAMEISTKQEDYPNLDYRGLLKWSKETGVCLWSFHLPFKPFAELDISSSDKEMRKHSVEYTGELIKKAADIGIDKYIVHSGGLTKRTTRAEVTERLNCACESYAALAEVAASCGGVVAVENLPPVCVGKDVEEVAMLLSADERLRFCFDVNHLLPGDHTEFIRRFADRLITVHISDYDLVNERHWLPGEGKIDWQKVYQAFCQAGYEGPWLYELSFISQKTLIRERDLTCEDFVLNANEIFNNKPITVIPGTKTV